MIVIPPAWISHIKLDWESPKTRSYLEKLASNHSVIRYDKHGCGLSDRDRKDFTLEKEVSNLEAIINHLELPRLALFGYSQSGPISIAYAAKYPEHVSHLILYGTYARGVDTRTPELAASLQALPLSPSFLQMSVAQVYQMQRLLRWWPFLILWVVLVIQQPLLIS